MYAEKLARFGLEISPAEIVNPVVTMNRWLLRSHPDATVFSIAEEPLKDALRAAGIKVSGRAEEIDTIIASYDRSFGYCPLPGGRGEPDAAAIVDAIEACTGAGCEVNIGKPDPIMLETVMDGLDLEKRDCVMAGDRLYTETGRPSTSGCRPRWSLPATRRRRICRVNPGTRRTACSGG